LCCCLLSCGLQSSLCVWCKLSFLPFWHFV
jgi:hypothetical protein